MQLSSATRQPTSRLNSATQFSPVNPLKRSVRHFRQKCNFGPNWPNIHYKCLICTLAGNASFFFFEAHCFWKLYRELAVSQTMFFVPSREMRSDKCIAGFLAAVRRFLFDPLYPGIVPGMRTFSRWACPTRVTRMTCDPQSRAWSADQKNSDVAVCSDPVTTRRSLIMHLAPLYRLLVPTYPTCLLESAAKQIRYRWTRQS